MPHPVTANLLVCFLLISFRNTSAPWPAIKRDRTFVNQPLQKILIILIAGIGDLVLASKGIRAIRNGNPGAEIHLLTSTDAAPLAVNFGYVDRVWAFPIREFRKDKRYAADILRLARALRKIRFRVILNLYAVESFAGAVKMGLLFQCLGAARKIGHDSHGFGSFLTEKVSESVFRGRHVTEAMTEIAVKAGGIPDEKGIEVFWGGGTETKWIDLFGCPEATGELVVGINPGGDRNNRRWDPNRYAEVADRLAEGMGARIVLLGGPSETAVAQSIEITMQNKPINLSGQLNLNDLAYVLSKLDLLITNDSGPMHMAAALGVPLVAVFGPEDPARLGPYTDPRFYRIVSGFVPCSPCKKSTCDSMLCLDAISSDDVVRQCESLMGEFSCAARARFSVPTGADRPCEGQCR
jgi:heptosyltransferase-2